MEARSDLSGQVDHQLRGRDWGWGPQMLMMLQCLARCREEVCEALKVKQEDVELSMGMSGDFEEAVSRSSSHACHVAVLTLGGVKPNRSERGRSYQRRHANGVNSVGLLELLQPCLAQ